MTLRRLLKIAAIYLGVLAAASLLIPQAASSGLGHPLTSFDVFAARTIGALLLTVAILNWSASTSTVTSPFGVTFANIVMNAVLGTIDAINIIGGTIEPAVGAVSSSTRHSRPRSASISSAPWLAQGRPSSLS
jgi:hypothetical protein